MNEYELKSRLERNHRTSYGWALSCCFQDRQEAEDVLQTVYLKILEGRARYGGKSTFKTWLFSVIRKTAADARRKHRRRRLKLATYKEEGGHSDPGDEPDRKTHRSQVRALIRRALANLSDRQREVLQLVFYHELSLREAAEVMGVSIGSARMHYERGKKNLRHWMEETRVNDELHE